MVEVAVQLHRSLQLERQPCSLNRSSGAKLDKLLKAKVTSQFDLASGSKEVENSFRTTDLELDRLPVQRAASNRSGASALVSDACLVRLHHARIAATFRNA